MKANVKYGGRMLILGYSRRRNYDVGENGKDIASFPGDSRGRKDLLAYLGEIAQRDSVTVRLRRGIDNGMKKRLEALANVSVKGKC